jgi:hypothetical protein
MAESTSSKTGLCSDQTAQIIGIAHHPETGEFLYCEKHFSLSGERWRVDYESLTGLFASKDLDFSAGGSSPLVNQTDFRTGELRSVVTDKIDWKLSYRRNESTSVKSVNIPQKAGVVIDAGFDNFVRGRWSELENNQPVVFEFLSIPHLKTIGLRASKKSIEHCRSAFKEGAIENPNWMCLTVSADNRLLRLFVGNLVLLYDEKRRLRTFIGAVNLQDEKQQTQSAIIQYSYQDL